MLVTSIRRIHAIKKKHFFVVFKHKNVIIQNESTVESKVPPIPLPKQLNKYMNVSCCLVRDQSPWRWKPTIQPQMEGIHRPAFASAEWLFANRGA